MTFPVYWGQCSRCHGQGTMATRLLTWYPSLCPQLWPSAQVKEARLTPHVYVCEEIESCVFSHRICCFFLNKQFRSLLPDDNVPFISTEYLTTIFYILLLLCWSTCFFFFCIYVKPDVSDVGGKNGRSPHHPTSVKPGLRCLCLL